MSNLLLIYLVEICDIMKFILAIISVISGIVLFVIGGDTYNGHYEKNDFKKLLILWVIILIMFILIPSQEFFDYIIKSIN